MTWADFSAMIMANLPAALCLVAGLTLCTVEMFIPGFGVPGVTGLALLLAAVLLKAQSPQEALLYLLGIVALLTLMVTLALRSASGGRIWRSALVLKDSLSQEAGFSSVEDMASLLGRQGIALSTLRPSGTADFDGARFDVVSDGDFVRSGTTVKVVKVEGRRIVVEAVANKQMQA